MSDDFLDMKLIEGMKNLIILRTSSSVTWLPCGRERRSLQGSTARFKGMEGSAIKA